MANKTLSTATPSSPPKLGNSNNKIFLTLIITIVLLSIPTFYLYKQNHMLQDELNKKNIPLNQKAITIENQPNNQTTNDSKPSGKLFTDKSLPGFYMNVPEDWTVNIKPFKENDKPGSKIFKNSYLSCGYDCMYINLTKGNISLNIVFKSTESVYQTQQCIDATYTEITDSWYRINDSEEYLYVFNDVEIGKLESQDVPPQNSQKDKPKIDLNSTPQYRVCLTGGNGDFLDLTLPTLPKDKGILMEHPFINGNPDTATLNEADNIIKSIVGVGGVVTR